MNEEKSKPLEYQDYLDGTKQVLDDIQKEKEPYVTTVSGREFIVNPNVFSPKYFNDTELFADNLPVNEDEEMLEIGTGTGAISVTAIYKGAKKVIASDINPDAVENTKENIKKHNLKDRMEVRQGDLYEAIKENEKFDTIFWNTPFGLIEDKDIPDIEKSVFDPEYKSTERFIKEAKEHLKENGKLLIGFCSTLGRLDMLEKFTKEAGFEMKLIFEAESTEVHPVKFEIFEAKQI